MKTLIATIAIAILALTTVAVVLSILFIILMKHTSGRDMDSIIENEYNKQQKI